ncbi:MAG: secretin N-terminal domain-containing protein [Thermodesulfovibrionales bacterium]|nr:secretin N-terminal domain-containing protein [Thermodesulfovibrionales bacterium]
MRFRIFAVFLLICMLFSVRMSYPVFSQETGQGAGEDIGEEQRRLIQDKQQQIDSTIQDKLKKKLPGRETAGPSGLKPVTSTPTETDMQEMPVREPQELEQEEEQQPAPVQVEIKEEPAPPIKEQKQSGTPTVSFFFDDADIFEVAQTIFADVLRVNYLIDPQVKGRVNFRTVTPIPKDEVLSVMEIIFRLNGIGFVEEGGLYRIVPLSEVSKELVYAQVGKNPDKVAIEMFTFKNLDIKESMPDIENALGLHLKGGTVRIIPFFRMNALLVVASSQAQLEYIRQWVVTFDNMFAVAKPKIYVYSLQNSKATHIASLLQSIFTGTQSPTTSTTAQKTETAKTAGKTSAPSPAPAGAASQTGPAATVTSGGTFVSADTRIFADEITNTLIILASPTDYSFIEETIKKIDIMPRQVVIEGLIARVDLIDNLSFGVSWSLNSDINISGIKPFNRDINLDGDFFSKPLGTTYNTGAGDGFTFVGTDPSGIVRARLAAALKDSKAKILAAPHILVSDNREARIQVGSQIPLATQTSTGIETTTTVTSTIQYKDIGIILNVKPQINDSGLVALEITQEVSSLGDNVKVADQDFASINKTESTTNLVAQDGETIIIGGLIREDATKSKDGIPILSKIPIIGHLFSNTTDNTQRTELIILLTPHVIRNQREAGNVTTDYIDRYQGTTGDEALKDFIKEKTP